jgi:RNA polymerase sigma factor (sigma-70 family)
VSDPPLAELLIRHRPQVLRYVRRRAGGTLRFENAEDLVQGIHLRALERESALEYRSEPEFLGWLFTIVRGHLAHRREHWHALKRRPARLLRLTQGDTADPNAVREPAAQRTGPVTFAERRQQMERAVRALAMLLPRDADIVQCHTEGLSIHDLAARYDLSYVAAQRAQHRALERFRKAFDLASR